MDGIVVLVKSIIEDYYNCMCLFYEIFVHHCFQCSVKMLNNVSLYVRFVSGIKIHFPNILGTAGQL